MADQFEIQTAAKLTVLSEMLAMLFEEKLAEHPDPIRAVSEYADYVQTRSEGAKVDGVSDELAMRIEAEFALFFAQVKRRLLARRD